MARRRRKQLPEGVFPASISSLGHDGRGIAQIDGKTIFIDGALPGEDVEFAYTYSRSKFDEGRAVNILKASPERVEPPCQHALICGGCSLQHMNNDAQVTMKDGVLHEQLEHFGGVVPDEWLEPMRGDELAYRRKARLGAKWVEKKGGALVGFREKRNSFLADITRCEVLIEQVGSRISDFRELIGQLSIRSALPQIELATGDDACALIFRHLEPLPEADKTLLLNFCKEHNFHCYVQPGKPKTIEKIWPEDGLERLHYELEDFGIRFAFHPTDFTQVNASINKLMVKKAVDLLDVQPEDRVLDLFCGLGNFTLPLATKSQHVMGVEVSEAMVARGYENARLNNIENIEFHAADLQVPFDEQDWAQQGFDRVLIDPPRSGALEVIHFLSKLNAKRIVYVSCNPSTLARDAGELVKYGYRLTKAGMMDMFPHTTHVESIAVFDKI